MAFWLAHLFVEVRWRETYMRALSNASKGRRVRVRGWAGEVEDQSVGGYRFAAGGTLARTGESREFHTLSSSARSVPGP